MKIIILFVVGITSCIFTVREDIQAYKSGEYNPYIFRTRHGHGWKNTEFFAYVGVIIPIYLIEVYSYVYLYFLIILGIESLTTNILNFNIYKRVRIKKILIHTLIHDLLFIIFIIIVSYMQFVLKLKFFIKY